MRNLKLIPELNPNLLYKLLLDKIESIGESQKKIALSTSERIQVFNISDIIRCESQDNYTKFFIKGHKPLLISRTLKEYDEILKDDNFLRVHQTHLINLDFIKSYEKQSGGYILMEDDSDIPVAQRKKEWVINILKSLAS